MAVEAYSVGFEKANYHAPIGPFQEREAVLQAREAGIVDNLSSYVGEYRLGVKFDEYFYNIGQNPETGERFLMSKEQKPVREVYRNAIFERERLGLSTRREVAECLGFEKFEREVIESEEGTMAIWVSPPGAKNDGYGDYSFTFIGQVEEGEEGRRVRMIPYRNQASINEHNKYLSEITGENVDFSADIEFLNSPFVVKKRPGLENSEDILRAIGENEEFDNGWRKDFVRENWFMFQHFLNQVKDNATDEELAKTRNAIEFCAIEYKNRMGKEVVMEDKYEYQLPILSAEEYVDKFGGYELPKVSGSCGPSGEDMSGLSTPMEFQELFSKSLSSEEDEFGSLKFKCPEKSCGKENVRPRGKLLEKCQHCRSTKVAC